MSPIAVRKGHSDPAACSREKCATTISCLWSSLPPCFTDCRDCLAGQRLQKRHAAHIDRIVHLSTLCSTSKSMSVSCTSALSDVSTNPPGSALGIIGASCLVPSARLAAHSRIAYMQRGFMAASATTWLRTAAMFLITKRHPERSGAPRQRLQLSRGARQYRHSLFTDGLLCAQLGCNATDYLPTHEHPEMADTVEGDGFRLRRATALHAARAQ